MSTNKFYYPFEQPIFILEKQLEEVCSADGETDKDLIQQLEENLRRTRERIYGELTPIQRTQLARHPARPTSKDYIDGLLENFEELHGDRCFGDDAALITGIGYLGQHRVLVVAEQKGKSMAENLKRNFGMPHPEGYRKAQRLMRLAERFGLAVLNFIDTPGAYPGLEAEARGQSEAIACSLLQMSQLRTPIISVVIAEGGSGGALALGVADRVYMLENAIYSVISPEGCASILWKDAGKAEEAAGTLRISASEWKNLGLIDDFVPEPLGGVHQDLNYSLERVREILLRDFDLLSKQNIDDVLEARYQRYRRMGIWSEKKEIGGRVKP